MRIDRTHSEDHYRYDPLEGRWTSLPTNRRFTGQSGWRLISPRCVPPTVHVFDITDGTDQRTLSHAPMKWPWPVLPTPSQALDGTDESGESPAMQNLILFSYLSPLARKYYHGPSDLTGRIIDLLI